MCQLGSDCNLRKSRKQRAIHIPQTEWMDALIPNLGRFFFEDFLHGSSHGCFVSQMHKHVASASSKKHDAEAKSFI